MDTSLVAKKSFIGLILDLWEVLEVLSPPPGQEPPRLRRAAGRAPPPSVRCRHPPVEMEVDAADAAPPSPRPISRRTRSQAAPGWTAQEMLTLANEVAAVEEDCRRALSFYQRWVIVADNCSSILGGAPRSANQCRRQWHAMVADYRRIRAWEETNNGSYWSLDGKGRRAARFPVDFDREVFGAIARSLRAHEGGVAETGNALSESETQNSHPGKDEDAEVIVVAEILGSKKTKQTKSSDTAERMEDMAGKLQECAQHILAIVKGELGKDDAAKGPLPVDLKKPSSVYIESKRHQADELIKALRNLIGSLHHFSELAGQLDVLLGYSSDSNCTFSLLNSQGRVVSDDTTRHLLLSCWRGSRYLYM
ncbi:hypothetical protein Taro_036969 [Colocasia esculenta]|uniref:Myb-like domain-containing protein n=1 Tax=Colocasia esculenta TaxID=4460 RepID=A0A843W9V6_COLES|nr:hypothetical protein [Colocasia esculenta]